MSKRTLKITTEKDRYNALATINDLDLTKPLTLTIAPYEENISSAQRRLYWGWLTDASKTTINEYAGHTKEDWHEMVKVRFLIPIFERDNEGYAEMMDALREVRPNHVWLTLRKHIIKETSITDATVKQMAEYLTDIERYFHDFGITLRTDQYLYDMAFKK